MRSRIAAAWFLLAASAAAVASAQHAGLSQDRPRPLHRRLALCDAVAIGEIEAVELGRIRVVTAVALRGAPPARLELKRAPSSPPALSPGDRLVLLLQGARSPYLLVDGTDELWKLGSPDGDAALAESLRALDAERADSNALANRYADWLVSGDIARARRAAQAFEGDTGLIARAPDALPTALAAAALAAGDPLLRDDAARAAVKSEAALAALLEGLPGSAADPEVVAQGLLASLPRASGRAAALRCLVHPSPAVRGAVLRFGSGLARDPALREELQRVARGDPDEQLRLAARRALSAR